MIFNYPVQQSASTTFNIDDDVYIVPASVTRGELGIMTGAVMTSSHVYYTMTFNSSSVTDTFGGTLNKFSIVVDELSSISNLGSGLTGGITSITPSTAYINGSLDLRYNGVSKYTVPLTSNGVTANYGYVPIDTSSISESIQLHSINGNEISIELSCSFDLNTSAITLNTFDTGVDYSTGDGCDATASKWAVYFVDAYITIAFSADLTYDAIYGYK